jgi:hypothetical protein
MNPAALYIYRSEMQSAALVRNPTVPSRDGSKRIATTISGITAHADVFALHVSLKAVDEAQDVSFTPAIADGITLSIAYANGASAVGGLGRRSVGTGIAVAKMESRVTKRRIDAQMAVSPLPSPGEVRILLAMEDGSKLGEWSLDGESILESARTVIDHEST